MKQFQPRHNPPRCVTYARVSTSSQAKEEKESLPWQTEKCVAYAQNKGWEIVDSFEEAVSGTKLLRPEFSKIMLLAQQGEIDYVVIALVNREARNLMVSAQLRGQLAAYGVETVYTDVDTSTKEGRLIADVLRMFAEVDRDATVERLARGREQAMRRGQIMGMGRQTQPYGWRYNKDKKTLEHDPDEAPVIAMVFNWIATEGLSLNKTCQRLMAMGIKPRRAKGWNASTLSYALKNTIHYGRFIYNKHEVCEPQTRRKQGILARDKTSHKARPATDWIEYQVEPIISKDLYDQAMEAIAANKSHPQHDKPMFEYLVSHGKMTCDLCGTSLQGWHNTHPRSYYRCRGKRSDVKGLGKVRCASKLLKHQAVDEAVWQTVWKMLTNPHIPYQKAKNIQEDTQAKLDADALTAMLLHEAELEQRFSRLLDLYETGGIDRARYDQRKAEIDQQLTSLNEQREKIMARVQARQQAKADAEMLQLVGATFQGLDPNPSMEIKRRVLETMNIKVYSDGSGTVEGLRIEGLLTDAVLRLAPVPGIHSEFVIVTDTKNLGDNPQEWLKQRVKEMQHSLVAAKSNIGVVAGPARPNHVTLPDRTGGTVEFHTKPRRSLDSIQPENLALYVPFTTKVNV